MVILNPGRADPRSYAFQKAYSEGCDIVAKAVDQLKIILPFLKPSDEDITSFVYDLLLYAPKYQENPVALFQHHCKEFIAYKDMNDEAIQAMAEQHADFMAYRIRDVVEKLNTEEKLVAKTKIFSSTLSDAVMKKIQDQRIAVYMKRLFQHLNESPLLGKIFSDAEEDKFVEIFAQLGFCERMGSYLFEMQSAEFELLNQRIPDALPLRYNPWTVKVALTIIGVAIMTLNII